MSAEAVVWVMERGADETIFFIWGRVGATATSVAGVLPSGSWTVARWPDEASCRKTVIDSVDRMELEGYDLAVGPYVLDMTQSEAEHAITDKTFRSRRLAERVELLRIKEALAI